MRPQMQEHLETLLLAERDRTADLLRRVEEDQSESPSASGGATTRVEWTQADAASDTQEQEADSLTMTRASAHLAVVDDALRLLAKDPDALARCGRCGSPVERARLELVPWSRLCAACAAADGLARD